MTPYILARLVPWAQFCRNTMQTFGLLALFSLLTLLASLAGGWLPLIVKFDHRRMQMMMSFVAGLMLGVAMFIMLPHAAQPPATLDQAVIWQMVGLLTMFFLLRAFHFHQHEPLSSAQPADSGHESHDHDHDHDHAHHHDHGHPHLHQHPLSWIGVGIGLTVHSLLDGIAMAAAVLAGAHVPGGGIWVGFGTFLAILLHKPLDAMAITTMMTAAGASVARRQFVNALFGLTCPLGAVLFFGYLNRSPAPAEAGTIAACALAFSAGVFLCISLSDLLPEIQFHAHDRIKLSALLLLGVGTAFVTALVEHSSHDHDQHNHDQRERHEDHDGHEGHARTSRQSRLMMPQPMTRTKG